MARLVSPPISELKKLRTPLQDGELEFFNFLNSNLDERWEIYIQPHLNGLRPDFVLLHPIKGVAIFEVKDWDLDKIDYSTVSQDGEIPLLRGTKNGKQFFLTNSKNPVEQIYMYRQELIELYCPRLGGRAELKNITAGIIFSRSSTKATKEFLAKSLAYRKMDHFPDTYPVVGQDLLKGGDIEMIFPRAINKSRNKVNSDAIKDLRSWLVEPDVSAKQRRPLTFDARQKKIVTSRTNTGYRRIKGAAGSGKSTMLAARAAQLASEGKSVLVVCYNITVLNFLRDLSKRWPVDIKVGDGKITWLNYHRWCKRLAFQSSRQMEYDRLWKIFFKNQNDSQYSIMMDQTLPQFIDKIFSETDDKIIKYDAVLVDEGQDFLPGWWNNLRKACKPKGEMLLFADMTQDIYEKSEAWTEEAMAGCGFNGGWIMFDVSYRLPTELVRYTADFAKKFLPEKSRIEPKLEQGELSIFPCKMRWVQTKNSLAAKVCLDEVLRIAPSADSGILAIPDIVFVGGTKEFGLNLVKALGNKGIRTIHTFSDNRWEERKLKNFFYLGDARVKVTTTHSFKGMETRSIVLFVSNSSSASDLQLIFTGLTRVKRHIDGSFITVVSTHAMLEDYGRSWPDFVSHY